MPSFTRGLWRIAAANVSSGNRVSLLHDGPETFHAMLRAVEDAKESVELESYIYRSDEVGERFATALRAAAQRGVEVRVLMDGIGGRGTSRAYVKSLRAAGVDVRVFNRPGLRRWLGLVPRDHRKVLVVDDLVGITGGVGIGREWLTGVQKVRRSRWRDTALRVEGPAAMDMSEAFDAMWTRAGGGKRRRGPRFLRRAARGAHLDPSTHESTLVGIIEGEPLRLRVARALQVQAISAERSIWIASAYFIPSLSEVEALTGAARDGVDVRILVPGRNDHPWVTLLTRRYYRGLLLNGVRIWEWQGEMMHAKTSVIDGSWVRVGSTDFNFLGVAINYELDAVVQDHALAYEAQQMFLDDLRNSREITLRSKLVAP
ncbi:MAG TPA: phospholipase D-like domain-containing protein [Gemmatimonadaceae bacterium]|jgi:cardiolipin synthase|nr:phospholipase D-like domain-containing protein [Gemmatimonadaceae bacterium]